MNLLKNDIQNNYIEIINKYFNEWNNIKNLEDYKRFTSKVPPFFGTYKTTTILDQIDNFIEQGLKIEVNDIMYKGFRNEIKTILEDTYR